MYSKGEMNNNWIQAKKKCIEAPDFIGDDLAEFILLSNIVCLETIRVGIL